MTFNYFEQWHLWKRVPPTSFQKCHIMLLWPGALYVWFGKSVSVVQLPRLHSFLAEQIQNSCIAFIAHMISFIISENHFSRFVHFFGLFQRTSTLPYKFPTMSTYAEWTSLCRHLLKNKSGVVDIRCLHRLTVTFTHLYREP